MKRRMVHLAAGLSMALFTFGALGSAWAGPATDVVKSKQSQLFTALKASDDKKIASLFDEMLDYGAFSEQSLGDEWKNRSAAEKTEFSSLLKQLVKHSYECNLKKLLKFDVEYLGEDAGSGNVMVKTRAKQGGGEPVEINFKMVDKGKDGWKVVDIETEGVSLVSNNRSTFVKIIRKDGFPALIQKMKDKLAKTSCDS